ncbi:choice-of-anchor M domain-containing protein [Streptomyces sp. NPDC023723]|uniref:choice-of-anchor M domain-containing protein n=1 Tax=Streptomyces sp. NPDC023723 TaxID=3154323 RepID=UPI0033FF08B9
MTPALARNGRALTGAVLTVATAVLLGAAGLVAGGSGDARAAGGAVVLDEGELDLTPRPVDGALQLLIDDRSGGTPVVREPSQVVLHAVPSTLQYTVDPLATALGTTTLDSWQLNGWEAANIFAPEPGWNGAEAGGDTDITLSGFEGPGDFGMATYTPEMDDVNAPAVPYLGTAASVPRSFTLPGGTERLLPTWQFTAEGVYRLTFTVRGGGTADTETLTVVVGDDVAPEDVLPGDGSTPAPTTPPPDTGPPSPAPAAHVIDNGHLDLAARPVDGALRFQVKEGSTQSYEWHEPDAVVLHVKPGARRKITAGYEFLGAVGDAVWWLPIQQVDGLVWPGFSTDQFTSSEIDGRVTFSLDAVRGPGSVSVFTEGSVGSVITHAHSGDGLPDRFDLSVPTHRHTVWAFAAEGVYRTTFTLSATLADGTEVSDTGTLAWVVGDGTDPSAVAPGAGDEPTATPTTTPGTTPTATSSGTASAAPGGSPAPSSVASASSDAAGAADGTGSGTGAVSTSSGTAGGSSSGNAGALATTGARVTVVAGIAVAALVLGGGTVFLVRRRRRTTP